MVLYKELIFLNSTNSIVADIVVDPKAIFLNKKILTLSSTTIISQSDFKIFINGLLLNKDRRTVEQTGSDITVTFNELEFLLTPEDQIIIVGKIE